MLDLYYEDLQIGHVFQSAGATITETQILDFALKYDPQAFHLDVVAAADSVYQGLIAPGMLTMAVTFRLWYDAGVVRHASLGSPGIDEMRWLKPVRPGDTLTVQVKVLDKRESSSRPERGIANMEFRTINQLGVDVMSYKAIQFLKKRHSPG